MSEEFRETLPPEEKLEFGGENLNEPIKKQRYKVEIISDLNEKILREVCEIERESFPEEIQSSPEDLKEVLENKDGIHLLIKDEKGEVLGNILSLRQSQEYDDLYGYDSNFTNDKDALYIESIAVKPQSRKLEVFNSLLKTLKKEAEDRNYKKITMHARVSTGLSEVLQKRYGAKCVRRIENWHDFGEPFDYLEVEILGDEK